MPVHIHLPETVLRLNPLSAEAHYDAGLCLTQLGRKDEATVFKNKALARANALQLYVYGRQLQGDKKQDEAFALYRSNAKKYPDDWTSHLGLARVYSGQGDFDSAVKEIKTSLGGAPDANKSSLENYVKRLQAKDDINR